MAVLEIDVQTRITNVPLRDCQIIGVTELA